MTLTRAVAAAVLATAALSLPGCRKAGDGRKPDSAPPAPAAEAAPAPPPADTSEAPADLTGIWTVVGHSIPGVAAMSDAEAATWHGRTIRLSGVEALAAGNRCDGPTYTTRSVPRDSLLGIEFNLPPGSLPALAAHERVRVQEVFCGGARWSAMGSRLIATDGGHALAPWDGVFFELARDRDFEAIGQEPGWKLEIVKGKEIVFTYAYGASKAVTPAPRPETDPETGARTYRAVTEASDLAVSIEPRACTDAMSGKPFETTVTVTLNGTAYHGCGGPLP
ncbi:MAG TPA: hypothetical protein VFT84_11885 [Gemmatimonadales bacterium]|nr:hypothetical protein [Gemmatimonadales bacterium]